jgi:ectoine hydroxylase-related dioxygenase (phytanoyl-CoA dioxygenase family)
MISAEQVAFYRDQGYVVVDDVIGPELLARMQRVIDELTNKARGVTTHNDVYDLEPTHTPANPRVRRIKKPHLVDAVFQEALKSPVLVDVLRKLIGPDVRLHGSKLNVKAPRYGSPVEWHQDWAFYPHTNDDILAIGVMLDDVAPENGPMLVLPGTHKGPTYDHHAEGRFCGAVDPTACDLDFSKAVACTGRAGSASFHHVRLVHGSAQNTSDRPRQLLLYECAAADAWPLVNFTTLEEFDGRMMFGSPTIQPRVTDVPIRMPLPPALNQGSIYENQSAVRARYFEVKAAAT